MGRPNAGAHVFVDESKAGKYLMAAATVPHGDLPEARRHVRSLRHRGAPTIHMRKESDRSRKHILDGLIDFGFQTTMIVGRRGGPELDRRRECLATVVRNCAKIQAGRLVIERDDSAISHDRELLRAEVHRLSIATEYTWLARNEEALLWVSDATAWSYAQGGTWRTRAQRLICHEMAAIRL